MKIELGTLALVALIVSSSVALADCNGGERKKITNLLSSQGYKVVDVDCRDHDDDGPAYEVDAIKDGNKLELWLNEKMKVTAIHNWWD